jgi:toxin YhaV
MKVNGWTLLFHDAVIKQLETLVGAVERAHRADPKNFVANANTKTLAALAKLMLEVIPADPAKPEYRQGNTLGPEHRYWFRAKFFAWFRLFFRYDSQAKLIVYAWLNDESTLRKSGSKHDPYEVFRRMLKSGNPPDEWNALVKSAHSVPEKMESVLKARKGLEQRIFK